MNNVKHSKGDPNWGTPPDLVHLIRTALRGICLDPFGSIISNRTVQADHIWTLSDNGFIQPWSARSALVNPPGLKVRLAWDKFCQEFGATRLESMVWVGFSVEQLCLLSTPNREGETDEQRWADGRYVPTDFSCVILRKRISFVKENGDTGSPSHGNFLCCPGVPHATVVATFGHLGQVTKGSLSC